MVEKKRNLETLASDLQQDQLNREVKTQKTNYSRWIIMVISLLGVLLIGLGVRAYRNRDLSELELQTYIDGLVASESDYSFDWSLEEVKALEFSTKDDRKGSSLKDVLSTHGKPSSAELIAGKEDIDAFQISYLSNKYDYSIPYRKVTLLFKKVDGVFRLYSREAEGEFSDSPFVAQWHTTFDWSQDDFDALRPTNYLDPQSEGTSYQEVIDQHDLPNSVAYSLLDDTEHVYAFYYRIGVKEWRKEDHVSLLFLGHDGKEPHLVSVDGMIGGEEGEKSTE